MIDEKPFLQEGWHLELFNEDDIVWSDDPIYMIEEDGVYYSPDEGEMIVFEVKTKETPLTITSFTMSEATGKPAGTPVKFTVNATGGTGKLQYMFYYEKDCYVSIFRNYAETNYVTCNPGTGKYNIYVDVKDENGNVKTSMITYEWK